MFNNLRNQCLILFFGVLFVEDAIGFIFKANTSKEIERTMPTKDCIIRITKSFHRILNESTFKNAYSSFIGFVSELHIAESISILNVVHSECHITDIFEVFRFLDTIRVDNVFTVTDVISYTVLAVVNLCIFFRN